MKLQNITQLAVLCGFLVTFGCQQPAAVESGSEIIYEFRTEIDNPLFDSNEEDAGLGH